MNDNLLLTLREISQTGRRHAGKLVCFNACVLLLAVLAILFWPRQYGSEAKLWLKIGRENSRIDPSASTGETVHITESSREDEVKSVLDVICSRGVITEVVDAMSPAVVLGDAPVAGETGDVPEQAPNAVRDTMGAVLGTVGKIIGSIDPVSDKERAIREISENVYAEAQRRSNVIKVHFASTSPDLAQQILQRLIEQYQTQHADIHRTSGSLPFFDQQCASLKQLVEKNAEELTQLMKDINVASIDGQRQNLEAEMLHVQTAKITAESEVSKARALVEELTALLSTHPQYIRSEEKNVPNTGRDELQKSLYDLQVTRMELEAKHAKNHPLVKRARAQEEAAVAELTEAATMSRSEISEALNTVHQALALDLAKANADQAAHKATLTSVLRHEEKLIDKIAKLNEADIQIKQKQRELALSEENYINYAKSVEDARINEALSESAISNIAIAQSPTYQEKPVSPSKALIGAAGMAAMFFGTILMVGYYQATDSFQFQREISAITQDHLSIEDAMKLNRHQNVRLLVLRSDLDEEETLKALNGNGKSEKPNGRVDDSKSPPQPTELT